MSADPITQFVGEYRFLDWAAPASILFPRLDAKRTINFDHVQSYGNVREAFRAVEQRRADLLDQEPEGELGLMCQDLDDIKETILLWLLKQKFDPTIRPKLAWKLVYTESRDLYYGNNQRDFYWGCDPITLEGENKLGKLLMVVRDEIWNATQIVSPRKMGLPLR
jgi:predicted NAD-dependent protein-ADP-ribosyltransferase YbiA (DUF1768 family)